MTLNNAIGRVELERPGEAQRTEMMVWIEQLDRRFWREHVLRHEGGASIPEPDYTDDADHELLIPCPYDEIYIHHLYANIDYRLGEIARYNNSTVLFQDAWRDACKAWRREHMPLGAAIRHVIYGDGRKGGDM